MTLQAGTPIGKYVVRQKLAEGGMAEIYLASVRGPEGFEKDVVIKRIRAFLATDPEFVQMFIAEARTASRLDHANIVQIFDFDKHEDSFYLAMEYIRGRSLWELRRKCREQMIPMPPTLVAQIGLEVARGLHYAHGLRDRGALVGLVHRDVTPHNVLMSWEGAVKLTDFGIAKAGSKATSPGMLKGKFSYMSPEQARGDEVDARTDVFALGVVLWEMLTGGKLFEGDGDIAVLRAVQQSKIAPPARLNPDVPLALDAIVMRALERNLTGRFGSAQELERELGRFILQHAKSIDDTDVGGFLRRVFPEEMGEDGRERTESGVRAVDSGVDATPDTGPSRREPTAVMSGSPRSGRRPSWDEDADANTFVKEGPVKRATAPMPASGKADAALARGEGTGATSNIRRPIAAAADHGEGGAAATDASSASRADGAEAPAERDGAAAPRANFSVAPPANPAAAAATQKLGVDDLKAELERMRSVARAGSPAPPTPAKPAGAPKPTRRRRWSAIGGAVGLVAVGAAVAALTQRAPSSPGDERPPDAVAAIVTPAPSPAPTLAPAPLAAAESDAGAPEHAPTTVAPAPIIVDAGAPEAPIAAVQPAKAKGVLVVSVSPWANVSIDGRARGEISGVREFALPAGKYIIRFAHPRKTTEKLVTVKEGRKQSVDFDVFRE